MNECYVTFRSVTPAQRGEGLLRRTGVDCKLQRTPRWMEAQGCGYCLKLRLQDMKQATELLRQKQIPFRKLYLQQEDGETEEITL